jgi:hypothetical protein
MSAKLERITRAREINLSLRMLIVVNGVPVLWRRAELRDNSWGHGADRYALVIWRRDGTTQRWRLTEVPTVWGRPSGRRVLYVKGELGGEG